MTQSTGHADIDALRRFNRLYTRRLGLLNPHLDGSPFTLTEARILFELAQTDGPTAADIGRMLGLDRGQLSRTLKRFSQRGLVETRGDQRGGRRVLISLTDTGREVFAALEGNTRGAIGEMLDALPQAKRQSLVDAANVITNALSDVPPALVLRALRPGDLGAVIARQSALYTQEYGWNGEYETLVLRIMAQFAASFDPGREAGWIAEIDGRMAGSIFLVRGEQPNTAKLRMLYVEPDARGMRVGSTLVSACITRAKDIGYERLELWTNSILSSARHIYERAGFKLVSEAPHHAFGHDLVEQTWALDLRRAGD